MVKEIDVTDVRGRKSKTKAFTTRQEADDILDTLHGFKNKGKGWWGDSQGHRKAALKAERKDAINEPIRTTSKRIKALPEKATVTLTLNALKRNLIWDTLYGARAKGRYSDQPEKVQALEELMDSMRVIDEYHNRIITQKALPEKATVTLTLNALKRNLIWDALYGSRAQGRYSDQPEKVQALEELMDSMRVIDLHERKEAIKTEAKSASNTPKPKDIWLSIRSNEMMRDTMKALIQEIKSHNIQYTSYASGNGNRLYLHLKNCPESFNKELGNWVYYQPVTQMKKPPNVSDYDVTDW